MAAKHIHRTALWASFCAVALGLAGNVADAQTFTMRVEYAVVYSDAFPQGRIIPSPPYTVCRNNAITFRFRYTWTNTFQDYVWTEAFPSPYPYYYVQGVSQNPLYLPPAQPGNPVIRLVDVGLISGSVNTAGSRQLSFRGRTQGFSGHPIQTASTSVLVETQIEPPPIQYGEIADGTLDMPTRPWFRWSDSLSDNDRLDVAQCSNTEAVLPQNCGSTTMPGLPSDADCGESDYCWVGTDYRHRVVTPLAPATAYQYRVLGRNQCGVSSEFDQTPPRPFFQTAQACFVIANGTIPDGGVVHFDAATVGLNPNSLVPNLRVTVHAEHNDVSDLRLSLTKTSPVVAGPLLLMDRPSGSNCIGGRRIQAAFADNGTLIGAGCDATEPAINGRIAPSQALASFAPLEGAGTWRLSVEDTDVDGRAGTLLEWCLSSDVAIAPAAMLPPLIFANGFE